MEDAQEVPQARILHDGHFYRADIESRRALELVRAVDPHAAAALFERWRDEGRIRPDLTADQRHGIAPKLNESGPPIPLSETLTYGGREFRATREVLNRLNALDSESHRRWSEADLGSGSAPQNRAWAEEPAHELRSFIRRSLQAETLQYVGHVDHRDITVNGVTGKPWQNEQVAWEVDRHNLLFEDMRAGHVGMTVEGVRNHLGMEPSDAVRRGLVTVEDIGGGENGYRATPQLTRAVTHADEHGYLHLGVADSSWLVQEALLSPPGLAASQSRHFDSDEHTPRQAHRR
jgi:hypothetical protein